MIGVLCKIKCNCVLWYIMVWCSDYTIIWYGVFLYSMVWLQKYMTDVLQYYMQLYSIVCVGMVRYTVVLYDLQKYMIWFILVWYVIVSIVHYGVSCCMLQCTIVYYKLHYCFVFYSTLQVGDTPEYLLWCTLVLYVITIEVYDMVYYSIICGFVL